MNKYLLLIGLSIFINNSYAQLIIGNLKIQTAGENRINITNIGDETINNIQINNTFLRGEQKQLKPNATQTYLLKSYKNQSIKEKKEEEVLLDLLGINETIK